MAKYMCYCTAYHRELIKAVKNGKTMYEKLYEIYNSYWLRAHYYTEKLYFLAYKNYNFDLDGIFYEAQSDGYTPTILARIWGEMTDKELMKKCIEIMRIPHLNKMNLGPGWQKIHNVKL